MSFLSITSLAVTGKMHILEDLAAVKISEAAFMHTGHSRCLCNGRIPRS